MSACCVHSSVDNNQQYKEVFGTYECVLNSHSQVRSELFFFLNFSQSKIEQPKKKNRLRVLSFQFVELLLIKSVTVSNYYYANIDSGQKICRIQK